MVSLKSLIAISVALSSHALAQKTIQILAVQDLTLEDTFVFKPNQFVADVGDVLEFHFAPTGFLSSNHSVAQGSFDEACAPLDGGFFSGYVPALPDTELGEAETVFQVVVNSTEPIAFYCTTGQHCTRGMYGVVNPTSSQSRDTYKANIAVNGPSVAPLTITGGTLADNPGAIDVSTLAAAGSLTSSMVAVAGGVVSALLLLA